MPDFGAQKAVIASPDLVAAIKAVTVLEPVKIIAHHHGVVAQPLEGCDKSLSRYRKPVHSAASLIRARLINSAPRRETTIRSPFSSSVSVSRRLPSRSSSLCENFIVFWP